MAGADGFMPHLPSTHREGPRPEAGPRLLTEDREGYQEALGELQALNPRVAEDLRRMRQLTELLLRQRRHPGQARREFLAVAERQVPCYGPAGSELPSRVLVTGGTGCVGGALLRLLRAHGVEHLVSVSRRLPAAARTVPGVRYVRADVRQEEPLRALMQTERPEVVFHLAAQRQPALAEERVAETVSTNIFGTWSVLSAAGSAGVSQTVTASTGKALRYFADEVYAATKKVAEYLVAQAPLRWPISTSTVRFTHVVDNSVVYKRLENWARRGMPLRVHAPEIAFFAQSAREAAQLMVLAHQAVRAGSPVVALTDIGWPHELLPIALDIAEQYGGSSPIHISGFDRGYEDEIYPGTFDPLAQQTSSPLFNALEVRRRQRERFWPSRPEVQSVSLAPVSEPGVEQSLLELWSCLERGDGPQEVRAVLHRVSKQLLDGTFSAAPTEDLAWVHSLAERHRLTRENHVLVHRHLSDNLEERRHTPDAYRSAG